MRNSTHKHSHANICHTKIQPSYFEHNTIKPIHTRQSRTHPITYDTRLNRRRSANVAQLRRERHKVVVQRVATVRLQADDGANDRHQRHLNGERVARHSTCPAAALRFAAGAVRIVGRIARCRCRCDDAALLLLMLLALALALLHIDGTVNAGGLVVGLVDGGDSCCVARLLRRTFGGRLRWTAVAVVASFAGAVGVTVACGVAIAASRNGYIVAGWRYKKQNI